MNDNIIFKLLRSAQLVRYKIVNKSEYFRRREIDRSTKLGKNLDSER